MKENTPPRKPGRRRTLGLAALNVTPRPDAEHKSQRELELELEVRGLKQKLAEYEKKFNELKRKVTRLEGYEPYIQEALHAAQHANLPLDYPIPLPPPQASTAPAVDSSNTPDKKNPGENDLIVREVLSFLGSTDLQHCRLVSHLWNSHATSYLRLASPYIGFGSVQKVTEFVRVAKKAAWSTQFPYSKFIILNRFVPGMALQFGHFAPYITALQLNSTGGFSGQEHCINLLTVPKVLKSMPNLERLQLNALRFPKIFPTAIEEPGLTIQSLKTLRIDANFIETESVERILQISQEPKSSQIVREIFRIPPTLKRVSFGLTGFSLIPKFLEALVLVPTLEELEVTSVLVESHLNSILQNPKPFALKSLQLTILVESCQLLSRFLEAHASTLETLEIQMGAIYGVTFPATQFPTFPKLWNLKLLSSLRVGIDFPFRPTPTGEEFPVLRKLHLSNDIQAAYFGMSPPAWTNVVDLTCSPHFWAHYPVLIGQLSAVDYVFPNVKNLTLMRPLVRDLHDVVFKLPQLEVLHLGPIRNITETLTGIPQPEWIDASLDREYERNSLSKCFAIEFLQRTAAARGIRLNRLKNLKRLEIVGHRDLGYGQRNSSVNDTLAYGILLTLPKLESLVITNPELSESCILELRKHHHSVTFKTEKPPNEEKYHFLPRVYIG